MPKYSDILMDHFQSPRNAGRLKAADLVGGTGRLDRPPYMILHLNVDGTRITDARFETFGCGPAIAAGSIMTELIIGRTFEQCLTITADQINEALGGLPPDKRYCAGLPVKALRDALREVIEVLDTESDE